MVNKLGTLTLKNIGILMLLASANLHATTYLCIAEAGASVENTGREHFKSQVYDVSNYKLIMSNEAGPWQLKVHGMNYPIFDTCKSEFFCESPDGFMGVFFRSADGEFTYIIARAFESKSTRPDKTEMVTMKGLCSKL